MHKLSCPHCNKFMLFVVPKKGNICCTSCGEYFIADAKQTPKLDSQKTTAKGVNQKTISKKKSSKFSLVDAFAQPKSTQKKDAPSQSIHCPYCAKDLEESADLQGAFKRCHHCHAKIRFSKHEHPVTNHKPFFALKPNPEEILGILPGAHPSAIRQKWQVMLNQYPLQQYPYAFAQTIEAFFNLRQSHTNIPLWPSVLCKCFFCRAFFSLGSHICFACGNQSEALPHSESSVAIFFLKRKAGRSRYSQQIEAYIAAQQHMLSGEIEAASQEYSKAAKGLDTDAQARLLSYGIGLGQTLANFRFCAKERTVPVELYRILAQTMDISAEELRPFQPWPMDPDVASLGVARIQALLAYFYVAIDEITLAQTCLQGISPSLLQTLTMRQIQGVLCFKQEKYQEALEYLQTENLWPDITLLQARCWLFLNNLEQAQTLLESLDKRYSNNPLILYYLGCAYAYAGKVQKAEDCWQQVLQLEPNNQNSRIQLALLWMQQGQSQKTSSLLAEIKKTATTDPQILIAMGQIQLAVGEVKKATKSFENARSDPYAHYFLGKIYEMGGDDCRALAEYQMYLYREKSFRQLWLSRGCCHARIGEPKEAYTCLLQAYQMQERGDACLAALGYAAAVGKKDLKMAYECWSELLLRYPDHPEIIHNLEKVKTKILTEDVRIYSLAKFYSPDKNLVLQFDR